MHYVAFLRRARNTRSLAAETDEWTKDLSGGGGSIVNFASLAALRVTEMAGLSLALFLLAE